ncbi:MAG: cytochrome c family protein, partial [Eudoraea sp.]|nr:cytochrome c family protein [Eudoraea sp.]
MSTQAQLGKNLIAALQRGGTEEAIPFCNIRAIPLTDSIAIAANARIQRVTNKARNPVNMANKFEVSLIEAYQKQLSERQSLEPRINGESGSEAYYFP